MESCLGNRRVTPPCLYNAVVSDGAKEVRLDSRFDPFRFLKWGGISLGVLTLISTLIFWGLGRIYHRPDWTLMNCLFMTVITLTTIGYGDWLDLRNLYVAELFTMFLALVGIAVPAFLVSNITALIVEGLFTERFRRRRMERRIAELSDHIIVCGVGTTGLHVVSELLWTGRSVVAIDRDEDKLLRLCHELGEFPYVVGPAESDETLRAAGIERAHGLIACLTDDKDNVFVTLTARALNRTLRIISKVLDDTSRRKMVIAGANQTVNPTAVGGLRLVSEMVRPTAVTFLDNMLRDRGSTHRFEELVVEAGSPVAGKSLADSNLRGKGKSSLVVAAKRPGEKAFIYNPTADVLLEPGLVLVLLASSSELEELRPLFRAQM
jgi:voltage-gated potassium channel